jgi:putative FmdB family regulatory protein
VPGGSVREVSMPTYVYECNKCGDEFELYQSFSEEPLKKHPGCGGKVAKVFQPVGIVLKGSGFYKNDSRSSSKRANGGSSKSESTNSDSGSKSESTKAESGSKSKSESGSGSAKKSESSTSSASSS